MDKSTKSCNFLDDDFGNTKESRQRHQWFIKRHKVFGVMSHLMALVLVAGVIVIPILSFWSYQKFSETKGRVLGETTSALKEFNEAQLKLSDFDLQGSGEHFLRSYESLVRIEQDINRVGGVFSFLLKLMPKSRSYYNLLKAGQDISQAGYILSGINIISGDVLQGSEKITDDLKIIREKFKQAQPYLVRADQYMQAVDINDLPDEYQSDVRSVKMILDSITPEIDSSVEFLENLSSFLGADNWQRYLVLFQNNLELRPTGGFIGSVALIDFDGGQIIKMEVPEGGSYDYNYGIHQDILSPRPFRILNPSWQFQDCNWFPDGPTSAEKCAWFLEISTGTSVDGVITINLPFVVELLKVIGEIEMPEYGVTINYENFIDVMVSTVESNEVRATGKPKKILADLSLKLITSLEESFKDKGLAIQLITVLIDSLNQQDLLLFSRDNKIQNWLEARDWSGSLRSASSDYLHVNAATVNGGKSDFNIRQSVDYQVTVDDNDSLIATVSIKRKHLGVRVVPESLKTQAERDFNYLTTQPNLSYIRVYAPLGSEFLEISGDVADVSQLIPHINQSEFVTDKFLAQIVQDPVIIESAQDTRITQEFNKTVFGNYLLIDPGEEGQLVFKYRLPFQVNNVDYSLLIDRQPGIISNINCAYQGVELCQGILDKDMIVK